MPKLIFKGKVMEWPYSEEGVKKAVAFAKRVGLANKLQFPSGAKFAKLRQMAAKLLRVKKA